MDTTTAKELAKKIKISLDCIVREEYEMFLLKKIYESKFSKNLVFKDGTVLRLAYGSPRFSQDLGFEAIGKLDKEKFLRFIKKIQHPNIIEIKTRDKFYTLFALVKIRDKILPRSFSIKIEVSKRPGKWQKDKDYFDKVIISQTAVFSVFARIASLEKILKEKKDALKHRKAPRDIFDYWFINQLLKKQAKINLAGFDLSQVKSELHRLLPRPSLRIIESWLEKD